MSFSIGLIEVSSLGHAITIVDDMLKAADVEFVATERKLGGRLVTLVVEGEVAAVQQAVEVACERAIKKPNAHAVIANPHEETWKMLALSAARLAKKEK